MKKLLTILLVSLSLAVGATFLSATPMALTNDRAEAAYYNNCHTDLTGVTWCYRIGCTSFEYWALGCRDGWVATNRWYA